MNFPILLGALFLFLPNAHADLIISQGSDKHTITDQDLRSLQFDTVEVQDPVYGKPKRYTGYWLSDIFAKAGVNAFPSSTVWTITALDGYKVEVNSDDVLRTGARPFIAIRDLDATQDWIKFKQGKDLITPGPYYLVWQVPANMPKDVKLPWPYKVAEIAIAAAKPQEENKLLPGDPNRSVSATQGYKIFKVDCMSCHSLDLQGGTLGPELNVPKNILEYENRAFLKSFISDPNAFRARSKMPAFKDILTAQEIDDVLDYLAWMGKHNAKRFLKKNKPKIPTANRPKVSGSGTAAGSAINRILSN